MVRVEAGLAAEVLRRGGGGGGRRGGGGEGGERGLEEGAELVGGDAGPEDGDAGLGEDGGGVGLDGVRGDVRVGRLVERGAEAGAEGERVRGLEGAEGVVVRRGGGLVGADGRDVLEQLVPGELGGGEEGGEDVDEEGPVGGVWLCERGEM